MRTFFIASFVANLALALVSLNILPDPVATHFGANGAPDGWMSKGGHALFTLGMNVLLFCSIYWAARLVFVFPAKWVSLPNRDFWLSEEQRPQTERKMSAFMWEFGSAIFLFLLGVGILSIQANLAKPMRLNERLLLYGLGVFLVYTVWWTIRFYRAFRMPKQVDSSA